MIFKRKKKRAPFESSSGERINRKFCLRTSVDGFTLLRPADYYSIRENDESVMLPALDHRLEQIDFGHLDEENCPLQNNFIADTACKELLNKLTQFCDRDDVLCALLTRISADSNYVQKQCERQKAEQLRMEKELLHTQALLSFIAGEITAEEVLRIEK